MDANVGEGVEKSGIGDTGLREETSDSVEVTGGKDGSSSFITSGLWMCDMDRRGSMWGELDGSRSERLSVERGGDASMEARGGGVEEGRRGLGRGVLMESISKSRLA